MAKLLSIVRFVQVLAGIVAVFTIPVVWIAWDQEVLIIILAVIVASTALFTLISILLHRAFNQ